MVEVYVWNFSAKAIKGRGPIGHAAMQCGSEYISWWPVSAVDSPFDGRRPGIPSDFETDRRSEGLYEGHRRDPDYRALVHGLDEGAIRHWWLKFRSGNEYRLYAQNCSTVVAMALKAGGATGLSSGWGWAWDSWNTVWTPNDVRRFTESIRNHVSI